MLEIIKGAKVPDNSKLFEGYKIDSEWITANVNASKIRALFNEFIKLSESKLYSLFIETPTNLSDEKIIQNATENDFGIIEKAHYDVYYLDGIARGDLSDLLDLFEDILINDGMSKFGIITQDGVEIGKYQYNVIDLHCYEDSIEKYILTFENNKINEVDNLVTAYDFFSETNPGECELYFKDGKNIYDVVETLKQAGMYKAEVR